MLKYIVQRVLFAILVLFGVSLIIYILVRCMPVNFVESRLNPSGQLTGEELERLKALYGLAGTTFWDYIKGYFEWLWNCLQGNLGNSFLYSAPVGEVIVKNMGVSFAISFVSLILEFAIAIPLGIKCACNQYGKLDYTVTFLVMIGISFPSFFLGNLLIKWLAVGLGWFEPGGLHSADFVGVSSFAAFGDMVWHLVLPIFVLTILSVGSMVRYTRTNTLEVLNADYIRTARAKGLSEGKVVYKHVFRNTLIPLVTLFASILPTLFSGSMITEQVFDIPGIGNMAYQALLNGDVPFIMGYNMFLALLTVVGILLADLMYALVDPRVKLTK